MVNLAQHYLYIIVAASAVGKSVLMNKIREEGLWNTVNKYSTRDHRGVGDDVVKIADENILEQEKGSSDDEIRQIRMNYIESLCGDDKGVVYYKNNNFYGVNIEQIIIGLEQSNLAVIISDFHIIKKLKRIDKLKGRIRVLYIASTIDERELLKRYKSREATDFDERSDETLITIKSIQNMCTILSCAARLKYMSKIEDVLPLLNEQWNNYVPYFDTIKTRSMNIRMLYNRYIDNISEIDYPILNFYDLDYMYQQARNIIYNTVYRKERKTPPIFMVCAAPSSGKKTLMEIVGDLGKVNKNIVITTKYAKRRKRKTDGRDGMIAIGKSGDFSKYISDKNNVWSWVFHKGETEYAVNLSEIKENINKNVAQIFISNMAQINNARKLFPENIVVLYLHATHETATRTHIEEKRKDGLIDSIIENSQLTITYDEAEKMVDTEEKYQDKLQKLVKHDLDEIREIHDSYLDHNVFIDHVLLNTGTREDLVEQMINLINHYS